MSADCHVHMILDGAYYKTAMDAHKAAPRLDLIRRRLARYRDMGCTWLRDGGDRWNVGHTAKALAGEYGIVYRSPVFPIHKVGHYGGFIGRGFSTWREYVALLDEVRAKDGDFVKLMVAGLMEFDRFGVLRGEPLPPEEIRELIHMAHEEGFSVMLHANGARTVQAVAEAGGDSVEHGAYLDGEALCAMAERGTVWVPTLSTIGNLRGTGRFQEDAVARILDSALENVRLFAHMGGLLAPGSDAGAYAVPHGRGTETEYALLEQALGGSCGEVLTRGLARIREVF